ncbi:MAG: ankyrin repeat domain-containing protein [Elusimicrobiales bacterium]|nr:ankyrin repeat domain-containing protein [Elusimicrobiales bacterium]
MKKVLSLTAAVMLAGAVFSFAQTCNCPCCQAGKCTCPAEGADNTASVKKVPAYLRLYAKDGGVVTEKKKQPKVKKVRTSEKGTKIKRHNSGSDALSGVVSAAVNTEKEKQETQNSKRKQKRIDEIAKAIEEDRFVSVQNLLDKVSPLDKATGKGASLFELAVSYERFYFVRYWLKDSRVSVLLKNEQNGLVCPLVERYDTPSDMKKRNLVEANRNAVLKLVLEGGANPNVLCHSPQDSEKAPAMFVAAGYWGNLPAVRLLANYGAKADFRILDIAAYWHRAGIVEFLLQKYPNIDKHQLNRCGENLVFEAVKSPLTKQDVDIALTVDVLLKAGVSKDVVATGGRFCTDEGLTPLQVAQREKLPLTAEILSR